MKEPTLDDLRAILFRGVQTKDANLDDLYAEIRALREDFNRLLGRRLNRSELAERLEISTTTLAKRVANRSVPRPLPGGRWLLADIMEWEREGEPGRTRFRRD